jgi:hypothetical protein
MKPSNVGYLREGNLAVCVSDADGYTPGDTRWITEPDTFAEISNWFLHYDIFDFRGNDPQDYDLYLVTLPVDEAIEDYDDAYMSIITEKDAAIVSDDNETITFNIDLECHNISHITKAAGVDYITVPYHTVVKLTIKQQEVC